ncbi:MAG: cation:dicarboxylase symporter family transporter, partial [Verrucomicrobia bacterium]|nr:cation:dicarboxylase symporter family transporter [Verrucomicrobiota bacterium]
MLKWLSDYNKHLILLSVASGILFGLWTPSLFESVQFLGTTFINLLKLFALPLICSALIAALGDLSGNLSTLKSLSKKLV